MTLFNVMEAGVLIALIAIDCTYTSARRTGDDVNTRILEPRHRRTPRCQWKYQTIVKGHSACLSPSSAVKEKGLQAGEGAVIVDIHNTVRRDVSPPAANMMVMSWDEEIANTAQRWAENCVIDHDQNYQRYAFGRFSVGQNLAWSSDKMTWSEAISMWVDEKKDFHYGRDPTGIVGHYTQMVWAETAKVGCGYADCRGRHYYVCNYGPGGNFNLKTPYRRGVSCADCQRHCNKGLCYCRGMEVCLNGGKLDLDTCKCICNIDLPFYIQPICALNCTGIEEPSYCKQWGSSGCLRYTNIPLECPKMCGLCPAAGVGFIEPESSATTTSLHYLTLVLCFVLCYIWQY